MDARDYPQINSDLLQRLWKRRGCPGVFRYGAFGALLELHPTPFGIITIINRRMQ